MWAVIQLPHFHEHVWYVGLHSQLWVMGRFAWKGSGFSCRKKHCIVVIISSTYVDERTTAWLSVWAWHMLMKEPLHGCQCELHTCWWKNHSMAVIVSFTHADERTIAWPSVWAWHMLMKEMLCGHQCEHCTCWWKKHCVAVTVSSAYVDQGNTAWLELQN